MVALELGERLRVRIEVAEGEPPASLGEKAPFLPAVGQRNEVSRRGELDVDLKLVLQARDRTQDGVLVRDELDVNVDRRRPPAKQDGGRPAGQVADALTLGGGVERGQEAPDPLRVG
jgi:hypothetical protein